MEDTLETYELKSITIFRGGREEHLLFASAILFVDTTYLAKSWFIDVSYLENRRFLEELAKSSDIKITLSTLTISGHILTGEGYLHPNLHADSAAIKGDGPLSGYELICRQET